ncbi:ribonuclease H-like protein [Auriscalpium vulgare]|uniref:Ribonuclease H-like protein n=1 Tax=Auriscalpium vulgare TaxID=40419 RepID=A0ACB8RV64_9AGAM|nr:ribonuclease H-like protein [Auriscalpium vulgare]
MSSTSPKRGASSPRKLGSKSPVPVRVAQGGAAGAPSQLQAGPSAPEPVLPTFPTYTWRNFAPNAQLLYLRDAEDADRALALLDAPVVGLDLEWRPNFKPGLPENPVALVQLASEDKILLIQVSAMQGFPAGLTLFLESSRTIKVGVGIQYDCKKLFRDYGVDVRQCVDLSLLARSVDDQWKGKYTNPIALARLSEIYLGSSLPKGKVQRSNWESSLTALQQEYAANDGQAGLIIYKTLIARANAMARVPEREYYSFDIIRGDLRDPNLRPWFAFNPFYDPGPPPPPRAQETPDGPRLVKSRPKVKAGAARA